MAKRPIKVQAGNKQGRRAFVLVDADGKTFDKWFFRQEKAQKRADQMNRGFVAPPRDKPAAPKRPDMDPGEIRRLMAEIGKKFEEKPKPRTAKPLPKPSPKPRAKTPEPSIPHRKQRIIRAAERRLRDMDTEQIRAVGGEFTARGLVRRLQDWAEGNVPAKELPFRVRAPIPKPAKIPAHPMYKGSGDGLQLKGTRVLPGIKTVSRDKLWYWIEDQIGKRKARRGWAGGLDAKWVKTRLKQLGFEMGPSLGRGHFGVVYDLLIPGTGNPSGYVVKFTVDPSEIATALRVKDLGESAFPYILGAWEMPNGNWMLIREGLFSFQAAFGDSPKKDWICEVSVTEEAYDVTRHGDALNDARRKLRDNKREAARAVAPRASWKMYEDFVKSLQRAYKGHGVIVMDLHCNNVRVRALPSGELQFVASDLGVSGGPDVEIPLAKNNPFWG